MAKRGGSVGCATTPRPATPADVCENCGEYYLSEPVAQRLYEKAEEAVARNAEVEVIRYAA